MKVKDVMSRDVFACTPDDTLEDAARVMWEHDCGAVPVVNGDSEVIAMLTDRDVCMSSYIQGRSLRDISVGTAMSRSVSTCQEDDDLEHAEELMRKAQVRRLPVVARGGRAVGILSINDLAREATRKGGKLDRARVIDDSSDPGLLARLDNPHYRARVERGIVIHIEGFDWNCPKYITPRYTEDEVEQRIKAATSALAPHAQRVLTLE